jgi:ADP-ribose pyrophosphatase YjhB (NUDIX family)
MSGPLERIDAAYALIQDPTTGNVLTVQSSEGFHTLPGGRVEPGETLVEAALRETLEESGYSVVVGRLVHITERIGGTHDIFFVFRAALTGAEPVQVDDDEIVSHEWVTPAVATERMSMWRVDFEELLAAEGAAHLVRPGERLGATGAK